MIEIRGKERDRKRERERGRDREGESECERERERESKVHTLQHKQNTTFIDLGGGTGFGLTALRTLEDYIDHSNYLYKKALQQTDTINHIYTQYTHSYTLPCLKYVMRR
jgi:hypothetical protein